MAVAERPIYHITHMDNLASIVAEDRLWCDAQRIAKNLISTNIGYSHIKARRLKRPVTVAAGGTLGQYVPFNFCPRSVMLYVNYIGQENYTGGQRPIVHLVSSTGRIPPTGRPWFFTDRHADLEYAHQWDDMAHLDEVAWHVMPLNYWAGDSDTKEKRQAEFLVHDWCPWAAIQSIGVMDQDMATMVSKAIAGAGHQPQVIVHRDWYY